MPSRGFEPLSFVPKTKMLSVTLRGLNKYCTRGIVFGKILKTIEKNEILD